MNDEPAKTKRAMGRGKGRGRPKAGSKPKGKQSSQSGLGANGQGLSELPQNNVEAGAGDSQNVLNSIGVRVHGETGASNDEDSYASSQPGGVEPEHPEQHLSGDQPNEASGDRSIKSETIESLRDPAVYGGTFCHDPEERFRYADKQVEFLRACRVIDENGKIDLDQYPRNVALAAVNEFGKTMLVADLIRYFLDWIPGCVVGFTSHVSRQCEMLESYLKRQQSLPRYHNWKCAGDKLEAPNGNWARWFTAKDEGAVESLHAPKFMIRICDEMKSMDDGIVDATARWKPKLTIFISSKGLMRGRFYEAHTVNRHLFTLVEASAFDCFWMSEKSIEHDIELNGGRQSALVRSMIFNEWSDVSVKNLISLELIEKAIKYPPYHQHNGMVIAGLDVSAAKKGGDECVLAWRRGNKVEGIWIVPYSDSEMEVIGRVVHKLREIKAKHVYVDAGGAGGFAASRLEEVLAGDKSLEVHRENFGGECVGFNSVAWRRGTELWCEVLNKLEKGTLGLPDDPKMVAQFTSREYVPRSDGKITLVDKQTMRRKGLRSPDVADAIALCLSEPFSVSSMKTIDAPIDYSVNGQSDSWKSYRGGASLGRM